MRFAVIDLGGSFIKSAIVDPEALALKHVHRTPFPPFLGDLPSSHREVSIEAIRESVESHLDRLEATGIPCDGLLASTQMHGFVLVDEQGRPASNFVSWQDERALEPSDGGSAVDRLRISVGDHDFARVGRDLGPGHAAAVLHAMQSRNPSSLDRLTPLPLPNAILGDGREPSADETLAASFGVYDLQQGSWHEALIARLGLDRLRWPRVTRFRDAIGDWTWGPRRIPIYSPIGDQQAALIGSLLSAGELSINIGTGSQVSVLGDAHPGDSAKSRPYPDGGPLRTVTHIPAGRALNALARLLRRDAEREEEFWATLDAELRDLPETDLAVDLSFFPAAFGNRGRIENIREASLTAPHLFLAAFHSMASSYFAAAQMLGGEHRSLVLSGGLAHRSHRLREIVARRFALPWRLSGAAEETLTGLGVLARVHAGLDSSVATATATLRRSRDAMR
jgi:sugar (pentulose or hexulose) kinase